ncbi:helix-turn-helix domain-containing protein [Methyloligella sp. 2.7D]|uniref:TetR/AcrR family transcriptional regulator n=1 Tax=unclassified Methyloligella TaxID=2625955 RepID=UPI00157E1F6E|nr:TetR/AcrR family transcriptional regulator [Methyloligella sp. GL2]QKP77242.1 TetR/AcrR family transcriptional regulator [Methyloligella sp. GL2]
MRHSEAQTTRERILEAAVRRFSEASYEQTGLRAIAADAGVDVAYVHRCYGSKQALFTAAVKAVMRPEHILPEEDADIAASLTERMILGDTSTDLPYGISPLGIVVHSLTSAEATEVLRTHILESFIEPLSARLKPPAPERAALAAAVLAGFSIMRDVVQLAPLQEDGNGALEQMIGRLFAEIIAGDLTAPTGRR